MEIFHPAELALAFFSHPDFTTRCELAQLAKADVLGLEVKTLPSLGHGKCVRGDE